MRNQSKHRLTCGPLLHIFDGLFEQRLHFSAVTYVTFVRRLKRLDDALKSPRTSRGSDDSRLAHQVSSLGALATLVTTVPSPSFSRTGILHVHSCETVLRISGVTLGVLLCAGAGAGASVGNARNPQPDILVAWAKASHTKNEKREKKIRFASSSSFLSHQRSQRKLRPHEQPLDETNVIQEV